jgi:ubiquinone/menaquinone biosynthesis C-methylase UbiE
MRRFFYWYLNKIIPFLGRFIARDERAYRYLADSIQDFLHPDKLSTIFKEAGLKSIRAFPLTLGITYLHEGIVP